MFVRRPRETALVILGSLLGTAIMTGSFVVGDTFNASIRRTAYTQLGPVDEIVSANGLAAAQVLASRLGSLRDPNVDGTLAIVLDHRVGGVDDRARARRAQGPTARDRLRGGTAVRWRPARDRDLGPDTRCG